MTKKWYETMQKTDYHLPLRVSEKAGVFSEEYFKQVYRREENSWLTLQEEVSKETFEDLCPDGFPSEEDLSGLLVLPAELEEARKDYLKMKEKERREFIPAPAFDPEQEKKLFRQMVRENQRQLEKDLPQQILDKVADLRVLALNRTTKEIKKEITAYSRANRKMVESAQTAYWKEFRKTFRKGEPAFMDRFEFHDCIVESCRRNGRDLVLSLDNSGGFTQVRQIRFRDCRILVQDKPLYGAWWLYDEVYKTAGGFEIHILLQKEELIDFIVEAADVELS